MIQLGVIVCLYTVLLSIAPDNSELNLLVESKKSSEQQSQQATSEDKAFLLKTSSPAYGTGVSLEVSQQSRFNHSVPAFCYARSVPSSTPKINKKPTITSITNTPDHFLITRETSLRDFPDPQATVIRRLVEGTTVTVISRDDYFWWEVDFDGRVGWVKRHLLQST